MTTTTEETKPKTPPPLEYDGTVYESTKTCEQALLDAASLLLKVGWSKYANKAGPRVGMILAMAMETPGGFDQRAEVRDYVRLAVGRYEIGGWECATSRALDDVIQALTDAAAAAKKAGR